MVNGFGTYRNSFARMRRDISPPSEGFNTSFSHEGVERLRETFIAKCEIITGQYCLFADADAGRYQLMSLILRLPLEQRLPTHNWNVASSWSEADLLASGAQIVALRTPLFPAVPALEALNAKALDATIPVEGGAGEKFDAGRIWGHRANPFGTRVEGGTAWPVTQAADGSYNVDTSPLEAGIKDAFDNAFNMLRNLATQVDALTKRSAQTPEKDRTPEDKRLFTLTTTVRDLRCAIISAHESATRRSQGGSRARSTTNRPHPKSGRPRGGEAEGF
jgi:hypothetical protein